MDNAHGFIAALLAACGLLAVIVGYFMVTALREIRTSDRVVGLCLMLCGMVALWLVGSAVQHAATAPLALGAVGMVRRTGARTPRTYTARDVVRALSDDDAPMAVDTRSQLYARRWLSGWFNGDTQDDTETPLA